MARLHCAWRPERNEPVRRVPRSPSVLDADDLRDVEADARHYALALARSRCWPASAPASATPASDRRARRRVRAAARVIRTRCGRGLGGLGGGGTPRLARTCSPAQHVSGPRPVSCAPWASRRAPALFRASEVFGATRWMLFPLTAIWMVAAMTLAIRQAFDYRSMGRAVAVSLLGWTVLVVVGGGDPGNLPGNTLSRSRCRRRSPNGRHCSRRGGASGWRRGRRRTIPTPGACRPAPCAPSLAYPSSSCRRPGG